MYIKGCSCGWCYECRNKNANQWRVRLKEEVKSKEFKNMIFATFTFSEEEYSKLAKEVRGDIIKQYGEVQGDIDRPFSKEKETDFFKVQVCGKMAEDCANYLAKGSQAGIRVFVLTHLFLNLKL